MLKIFKKYFLLIVLIIAGYLFLRTTKPVNESVPGPPGVASIDNVNQGPVAGTIALPYPWDNYVDQSGVESYVPLRAISQESVVVGGGCQDCSPFPNYYNAPAG